MKLFSPKGHSRMADWYAMGVVLYEFLMGVTPFNYGNATRDVLYTRIKQNMINIPDDISTECKDILVNVKFIHKRLS